MVACGLVGRSDLVVWYGGGAGLICRVLSGGRPGLLVWSGIRTWWSDFGKDLLAVVVV